MHPTNIILLTTSFPLSENSISGIFVARLVNRLVQVGKILVLTPTDGKKLEETEHSGFEVKTFRYAPRKLELLAHRPGGIPVALRVRPWLYLLVIPFLLGMCISLYRHARNKQQLVIHANWGICGCIAGIVGKLLNCPVVTTLRGEDFNSGRGSYMDNLILATTLRLSAATVTVSEAMHESLVQRYPQWGDKLYTIPNGVDEAFLSIADSRQNVDKNRSIHLITVGSLIPRKGLDQIIKAMSLLDSTISLTIVGDGTEKERLQNLVLENGLTERIIFKGSVAPATVASLLQEADIFILTSHSEGRPNVILEALASGLPVIATDIDGTRELVVEGQTGFLYKDGKINELVDHINFFTANPHMHEKFSRAAHNYIKEHGLSWEQTADRYQQLYDNVVDNLSTVSL